VGVNESRVEFLRRSQFSAVRSDEAMAELAAGMVVARYQPDDTMIQQGAPGERMLVIRSGCAEARVAGDDGVPVKVAEFGVGSCIGEMSLLTDDDASADVVATTEVEALALDRQAFSDLVAADPSLMRQLARLVTGRLRSTNLDFARSRVREEGVTRFLATNDGEGPAEIIGKDGSRKKLRRAIGKQAGSDAPLLIQGERGTGKALIARLVHNASDRRGGPIISADARSIDANTAGDRLFGHLADADAALTDARHRVCLMDLAHGGTLVIKSIDGLDPVVQERLERFVVHGDSGAGRRFDARIVATTRSPLDSAVQAGRFRPELARLLAANVIVELPLRDHVRDIPDLAAHYLALHASRLGKEVVRLDDEALDKLCAYDYAFGNLRELDEAVELAVIVSTDEVITEDELVLGPVERMEPGGFDLLQAAPKSLVDFAMRHFPSSVQLLTVPVLLFIIWQCFGGPGSARSNLGTALVWSIWWPALFISFLLVGRASCAVCPMGAATGFTQRLLSRQWRVPKWLKEHDRKLGIAGFFLIVWVEEVSAMRHSPVATGALLLTILAGVVVTAAIWPRRAFCRHICPLGTLAGLCAQSAMVEMRPTPSICSAKCRGTICFKGTEEVPGCPMSQHLRFVDGNDTCTLCMNCVRNCPHGSPRFNIRVPTRDLWTATQSRPEFGMFTAMLLGLLLGQLLLLDAEHHPATGLGLLLAEHHFVVVTAVLLLSGGLPMAALWWISRRDVDDGGGEARRQLWGRAVLWLPLVGAGFAAFHLAFLPELPAMQLVVGRMPLDAGATMDLPLLGLAQLATIGLGIVLAGVALWNARRRAVIGTASAWTRSDTLTLVAMAAYAAVTLIVMSRPAWLMF